MPWLTTSRFPDATTPIPRTLNMALGGLRDLSIIATPPARRLSIKTFIREHSIALVKEAVLRETLRGGQVLYLHNEVKTIEESARKLGELLPDLSIGVAHGHAEEPARSAGSGRSGAAAGRRGSMDEIGPGHAPELQSFISRAAAKKSVA